jgi:trans-L-3-hydroxyproline dehydratase
MALRPGPLSQFSPEKLTALPTGTAVSARMAALNARGQMKKGQTLTATSIIGSTLTGRIADIVTEGGKPAIIPEISGRGWATGIHQHMLDPDDLWPEGYRVNDTWGVS